MPRCMLTFTHLSDVTLEGPFYIRVKWGRDNFWCQKPHVTSNTKKDAKGNHVWTESIIISSKFDWKKDSIVFHVFEAGFFNSTAVGDATVQFNQLVLNQPTPVALQMTQRLGTVRVRGLLHVQIKALDFGHEIIQVAPQPQAFQPHYFIASSVPLGSSSASSAAPLPASTVTLGGGQQLYIQPMAGAPGVAPQQFQGAKGPLESSAPMAAMPTPNGGYLFYSVAPNGNAQPSQAPHAHISPLHNEPAPSYASLDASSQYTADFTYEAPSAPTETIINPPSNADYHGDGAHPLFVAEQAPPPFVRDAAPTFNFNEGDSLI